MRQEATTRCCDAQRTLAQRIWLCQRTGLAFAAADAWHAAQFHARRRNAHRAASSVRN